MLQLHPLERTINVHWGGEDFVIYGSYGATISSLQRFLIYSKDGIKWTKLPTAQLPPVGGLMVFGSGAWLAISNKVERSTDKFETWQTVASSLPIGGVRSVCCGKTKTAPPGAPVDDNGDPINKGVFVAIGIQPNDVAICSSVDLGKTWATNKTISKAQFDFENCFVSFANGRFFACASGRDAENGDQAPSGCKLYTSEDGVTWSGGQDILGDLTSKTWGSELDLDDTFYVNVIPYGLVHKKPPEQNGESGTYVIAGELSFGTGFSLFHAESATASFGGGTALGGQSLLSSSVGNSVEGDESNPPIIIHKGGNVGDFYLTNSPCFQGGNVAAVGNSSIIAAQTYSKSESTVNYPIAAGTGEEGQPIVGDVTEGYLTVSSDQEGVLNNYFCGGTFSRTIEAGTDGNGEPIIHDVSFAEALAAQVAAISRKQPGAGEDSPGTFLWVRRFAYDTFDEETSFPISNRGMEVRTSSDGSSFTVRSTPISGTVGGFAIAKGATPPPPTET